MISVVIITLNEAAQIAACLEPLKKVSDDIVVVDAFSNDETGAICKQYGARVFEKKWDNYSVNKNFGNSKAKHDWILSIDADEILSEELINSILGLNPEKGKVYALDRISSFCGKWIHHGSWYPDWKVRLFNRKEVQWQGDFVHETLNIPAGHELIRMPGKLWHNTFQNPEEYSQRQKKYADLAGRALFEKGKPYNFIKQWGAPIFRFVRDYFLKRGILDGKAGFTIAQINARVVFEKYRILRKLRKEARI